MNTPAAAAPTAAVTAAAAPEDLARAVATARHELGAIVTALMRVLLVVEAQSDAKAEATPAASEAKKGSQSRAGAGDDGQRKGGARLRELGVALPSFDALRKAVDKAVALHARRVDEAGALERGVQDAEREALVERRARLIEQVTAKNARVKTLIDHLRELHRDIVALFAPYKKPVPQQARKA